MPSPTRKESLSHFAARTMGVKPGKPRYQALKEELKRKKKA
jgi:hypothetical protein